MPKDCDTCNTIAENMSKAYAEGRYKAAEMHGKLLLAHLTHTCLKVSVIIVVVWKAVDWVMKIP